MTIIDETTATNSRKATTYNTYDQCDVEELYKGFLGEKDPLSWSGRSRNKNSSKFFRAMSPRLIPDDEDMWMYAPFPQIEWLWERREEHWALAEEYLRACFRMWRRETQRALMRRGAWVVRRGMRPAGVEAWGLGYQGPAP